MQNIEARYPQYGKLRRAPTSNRGPLKSSCLFVAALVLRPQMLMEETVKLCLEMEGTVESLFKKL